MRKAVTFLQSSYQLTNGKVPISPAMVVDVSGKVPQDVMEKFWQVAYEYSFDNVKSAVQDIVYLGYPMATILSQLFDDLIKKKMPDVDKALICEKLAEVRLFCSAFLALLLSHHCNHQYQAEKNLIDGSSEYLQLLDVASFIMRRCTQSSIDTIDNQTAFFH